MRLSLSQLAVLLAIAVLVGARAEGAVAPAHTLDQFAQQAWRLKDGLPQESVTALLQSRDGYLWFGTLDGLVRFDGVRFTTFNLIRELGIDSGVVLGLAQGPDGALWAATRSGVVRYRDGRFSVYDQRHGLTDLMIRCLAFDAQGVLWAGTRVGGLHRLDGERWTNSTVAQGLFDNDVRSMFAGGDGTLWVGTARGLNRLRQGRIERVQLPDTGHGPTVLALAEDEQGAIRVGTISGLLTVSRDGETVGTMLLPNRQVRALASGSNGDVWVGTTTGVARVRGQEVVEAPASDVPGRMDARSLLVDREGSLWIGTDGLGLRRLRDASVAMLRTNAGPDSNTLMSLLQAPDGAIWMAANCGGAIRWKDGVARAFTTADGLPDNCSRALALDRDGSVWVGTVAGAARISNGKVIQRVSRANGLSSDRVMALAVDRAGALWVGTTDGGLDRVDASGVTHYGLATGLTSDDVRVILEARRGGMWVGTYGGGLWHIQGDRVTTLTRKDGLTNGIVLSVHEDPDGTVWIGTNGGGLNRWANGTLRAIGTDAGLFTDGIFQILDDGRGSLWFGGNRGVSRVARAELDEFFRGKRSRVSAAWFSSAEGLAPGGVMGGAQPSGWVAASGELWFPTVDGAAVIDPRRLVVNRVPPPVHIEQLLVERNEWPDLGSARLPASSREVEVRYTAASFVAPEKVRFRYRLEGFRREWVDVGTRRAAYFTNLAPGTYRFEVQACNNDGVWNETAASLSFVVLPYFYQTRPFRLATGVLLAVLAFGAYRFRVRQLERHERELAQQVDEALAQVKVLSGLLPTCSSCKRIRDDGGEWRQMESYIRQHSQAEFSHGICPECMARLYPDFPEAHAPAALTPGHPPASRS